MFVCCSFRCQRLQIPVVPLFLSPLLSIFLSPPLALKLLLEESVSYRSFNYNPVIILESCWCGFKFRQTGNVLYSYD